MSQQLMVLFAVGVFYLFLDLSKMLSVAHQAQSHLRSTFQGYFWSIFFSEHYLKQNLFLLHGTIVKKG